MNILIILGHPRKESFSNALAGSLAMAGVLITHVPAPTISLTLLIRRLYRYIKNPFPPSRIDSLMIGALAYILWFALISLLELWLT